MIRLCYYVEGQTEQAFVALVLKPHLAGFGVMVMGAVLAASGRSGGRVVCGGGRSYPVMRNDLRRLLKQDAHADIRFTTLFDLYALYDDFPGRDDREAQQPGVYQRVRHLEERFAADVGDRRFIPHIQLHEYEAVLLSRPDEFALLYDNPGKGIATLAEAVAKAGGPELVNDSYDTCPSRRIKTEFPRYGKLADGPELAAAIGLPTIRSACPHFDCWLKTLEGLTVQGVGEPPVRPAGLVNDGPAPL